MTRVFERSSVTQHCSLPSVGIGLALALLVGGQRARSPTCRRPLETWEESKLYILEPFEKRGEMDQGIGLLAYYSLVRVAQGFLLGIADRHAARVPARRLADAARACSIRSCRSCGRSRRWPGCRSG